MSHPRDECPNCHLLFGTLDRLTGSREPTAGDYTMCRSCLVSLRFTATGLELADLAEAPPHVREALIAYRDASTCEGDENRPPPEKTPGGKEWRAERPALAGWQSFSEWDLYDWFCAAEKFPQPASDVSCFVGAHLAPHEAATCCESELGLLDEL